MADQHTQICGLFFLLPIFFALSTVLEVQLAIGLQTLIRAGVLTLTQQPPFPYISVAGCSPRYRFGMKQYLRTRIVAPVPQYCANFSYSKTSVLQSHPTFDGSHHTPKVTMIGNKSQSDRFQPPICAFLRASFFSLCIRPSSCFLATWQMQLFKLNILS